MEIKEDKVLDISERKNLFRIYYNDIYYNIFVEVPDAGGANRRATASQTSQKVAIPFHTIAFQRIIKNYERVLVIDIYYPLKQEGNSTHFTLDKENRVYLISDPSSIYKSSVISKGTWNSVSHWVNLEQILEVIANGKLYTSNNKQNIYLVHWKKLREFFDNVLAEKYINMLKEEFAEEISQDIEQLEGRLVSKHRSLFRELLIAKRGIGCEITNCSISLLEALIASHIRPVDNILHDKELSKEEKLRQIGSDNNGFLFCRNHDALFDRKLLTFTNEGKVISCDYLKNFINSFNLNCEEVFLKIKDEEIIDYLQYHQELFNGKVRRMRNVLEVK